MLTLRDMLPSYSITLSGRNLRQFWQFSYLPDSTVFQAIPINEQTWVICGGRNFADAEMFDSAMSDVVRQLGIPRRVVHGSASGADALAGRWAREKAIDVVEVPADWKTHGRAAGPKRNQEMLDRFNPAVVVAFPGGRGTADMVRRARDADITVIEIKLADHPKPLDAHGSRYWHKEHAGNA